MPMKLLKPRVLPPNSQVALLAPASALSTEKLEAGVSALAGLGFNPKIFLQPTREFLKRRSFASDSPQKRAQAFNSAISDKKIAAVWALRGGFGSMEILPDLDYRRIRQARKPIVGYSDVTALLHAVYCRSGLISFHGPMVGVEVARFTEEPEAKRSVAALLQMLSGVSQTRNYSCKTLRSGSASGPLLPANLSMLCALIGTPWEVKLDGHILVIEDINEPPYRIHRMLLQLKLAGKLRRLKGVVFGRFSGAEAVWGPRLENYLSTICETIFDKTKFPVCCGLQFGHAGTNLPVPVGCMASLTRGKLTLLESPIADEC